MASKSSSRRKYLPICGFILLILSLLLLGNFAAADDCDCFNCKIDPCDNFGTCDNSSGTCKCTDLWAGRDCSVPTCGSPPKGNARPARSSDARECTCDDGWGGGTCEVCSNDSACGYKGENSTCVKTFRMRREGFAYCKLKDSPLVNDDLHISLRCNVSQSTCEFEVWLEDIQDLSAPVEEVFACKLFSCNQTAGPLPGYKCATAKCMCHTKSEFCDSIKETVEVVDGPSSWTCTDANNCKFYQDALSGLFPRGADILCDVGECVNPNEGSGGDESEPVSNPPSPLLIGGISAGVLVFIMISVFVIRHVMARQRRFLENTERIRMLDEDDQRLMEGRHIPADLGFVNISYTVGSKTVLDGISGQVQRGRTLAIMGPSGAGKSSCLDILARKSKTGEVHGDIVINGKPMGRREFKRIIGYVDQEDVLMSTLTVKETLTYSALLRLPKGMSLAAKSSRVQEVMEELGIQHIAHSRVGAEGKRGISGGEKRRVSIAQELVTSPSVLFLDEPTSGLDSYNAHSVIECMSRLAKDSNRTVIFTIHQPRSDIFKMFDDLLLLARGQVIYLGPAMDAEEYVASIGYPCPRGFNIADHLIDLTMGAVSSTESNDGGSLRSPIQENGHAPRDSPESPYSETHPLASTNDTTSLVDEEALARHLSHLYRESPLAQSMLQALANTANLGADTDSVYSLEYQRLRNGRDKQQAVDFWGQLKVLSARTFTNLYRDPFLLIAHVGVSIILGVLCGGLFWQVTDDLAGVQNRLGSLFFMCALLAFGSLSSLELFVSERTLFVRERANNFYSTHAYFISKVLFDIIPLRLFPPLILGCVSYYMIGLNADVAIFGKFLLVLVMFNLVAAAVCLIIGAAFKQVALANLVASLTMLFSMLFGGFLLNKDHIPKTLDWIKYLSFFNYGFEALIVNELETVTLRDKDIVNLKIPGDVILVRFGFNPGSYWDDARILVGMFFGCMLIAYLILKFVVKERR